MVPFTSRVIEAVVAGALANRRYDVYEPFAFLSVGAINQMKKSEVKTKLQSRGMDVSGTVLVLKKELKKRVLMEKRGQADRPTVNIFTWRRVEIRSFLKAAGCTLPSNMRREDMLQRLVTTVEEAERGRVLRRAAGVNTPRRNKRAGAEVKDEEEEERPAKRVRTGKHSYSAVEVVSFMVKPVIVPVVAMAKGGKATAKTVKKVARRTKLAIQDSVRGYKKYRQEGGRLVHKAKVDAEAKKLQKLHKKYGKKTILGVSSFCGCGFGPKGLSEAQATRLAREVENSRLCRPVTDPIIKGYFGRPDEVERRLKEARFNANYANNKTTPTIVNPFSRPVRRRTRAQVKFNPKPAGSAFGVPDRVIIAKTILKRV